MVFHSSIVEARRKAGRANKPAWSIIDYLETKDEVSTQLVERRTNCIASNDGWNEAAFDATIDSFPNETLVYVDTDDESNKLDVTNFKEVCRVVKSMTKEGHTLKNKCLQANASVLNACYAIYKDASMIPPWINDLVQALLEDMSFQLYTDLSITKCPDERRRIENELKSLVADLKDAKTVTLVDYDSRADAKQAREGADSRRRASAMLTTRPQPQKTSMGGSLMACRAIGKFKMKR